MQLAKHPLNVLYFPVHLLLQVQLAVFEAYVVDLAGCCARSVFQVTIATHWPHGGQVSR